MSKSSSKQVAVDVDENDVFLNFLNKKTRNLNKKLREIEDLEKLENLKAEQIQKINSRDSVNAQIKENEKVISLYRSAMKEANQEASQKKKESAPKPVVETQVRVEEKIVINTKAVDEAREEAVLRLLKLSLVAQLNDAPQSAVNLYAATFQASGADNDTSLSQHLREAASQLNNYALGFDPASAEVDQFLSSHSHLTVADLVSHRQSNQQQANSPLVVDEEPQQQQNEVEEEVQQPLARNEPANEQVEEERKEARVEGRIL